MKPRRPPNLMADRARTAAAHGIRVGFSPSGSRIATGSHWSTPWPGPYVSSRNDYLYELESVLAEHNGNISWIAGHGIDVGDRYLAHLTFNHPGAWTTCADECRRVLRDEPGCDAADDWKVFQDIWTGCLSLVDATSTYRTSFWINGPIRHVGERCVAWYRDNSEAIVIGGDGVPAIEWPSLIGNQWVVTVYGGPTQLAVVDDTDVDDMLIQLAEQISRA